MKTLDVANLPDLPNDVADLILDGVYSLYEVNGEGQLFVLFTEEREQQFWLNGSGRVLTNPPPNPQVGDAISLRGQRSGGIQLNLAAL